MPHDRGLPKTGDSQEIGQDAYDCLRAKRPKGWQITELGGPNDFGFDLQVQISVARLVVHPSRVQLKGTRPPERSADGSFLTINLSTSTLRYFDNTDEPAGMHASGRKCNGTIDK